MTTPVPRRRAAARPRRLPGFSTSVAPLAFVLVAAAALIVSGQTEVEPTNPVTTASTLEVTRASAVCPPPTVEQLGRKDRQDFTAGLIAASPPADLFETTGKRHGKVSTTAMGNEHATHRLELTTRGPVAEAPLHVPVWATEVRATGQLAPAFAAFAGATLPARSGGGTAASSCPSPARDWWFVGPGTTTSQDSTLVMSNVETTEAVVDVTVHGRNGVAETVGTDGIIVPARATVTLPMASLLVDNDNLAVSVHATAGQVSAAVVDTWSEDVDPAGSDWIPSAALPDTEIVVPAVPAKASERTLLVVNPGERTATVTASVVDSQGTFASEDLPEFRVDPGGVTRMALPTTLGDGTVAIRLASSVPVTAAVRVRTDEPDVSYAAAAPALSVGTVLPLTLRGLTSDTDTSVVLASGTVAGQTPSANTSSVTITAVGRDGATLDERRVAIAANRLSILDPSQSRALRTAWAKAAYLVVRPESGDPTATVRLGTDDGVAILPGADAVVEVPARSVRPAG